MIYKKIFIVVIMAYSFILPATAEYIFLKDGSIIEGEIIRDETSNVIFRDKTKKQQKIQRKDILRILYTELKMGKVFIQKRDGKGIVAYIVDEDRETYTFRLDLYKPEEFVFKRTDVLFIAEKNASNLRTKGIVGPDFVDLEWDPPYDKVKKYKVYFKKNENDKYEMVDSTADTTITLENLSPRTTYHFIVTTIDSDGYESPASNELKIRTSVIINVVMKDGKKLKTYLLSEDSNNYRFCNDPGELPEYTVKRSEVETITEILSTKLRGRNQVTVNPGVLIPLGNFGSIFGAGYGGILEYTRLKIFFKNFETGLSTGFYYLPGKESSTLDITSTERAYLVPLFLHAGYRFNFTDNLSFKPYLYGGVCYLDMLYTEFDSFNLLETEEQLKTFGPAGGAGVLLKYSLNELFCISIRADAGVLINNNFFDYPFARAEIGIGIMF